MTLDNFFFLFLVLLWFIYDNIYVVKKIYINEKRKSVVDDPLFVCFEGIFLQVSISRTFELENAHWIDEIGKQNHQISRINFSLNKLKYLQNIYNIFFLFLSKFSFY